MTRQQFGVAVAQVALDADEGHALEREQRFKLRECNRAVAVVEVPRVPGPGESDALARQGLNLGAPFAEPRFVGGEIGDAGGDRARFGLGGERQAAERAMHVVRGKRLAARLA